MPNSCMYFYNDMVSINLIVKLLFFIMIIILNIRHPYTNWHLMEVVGKNSAWSPSSGFAAFTIIDYIISYRAV